MNLAQRTAAVIVMLSSALATAHESTDWRADAGAFRYAAQAATKAPDWLHWLRRPLVGEAPGRSREIDMAFFKEKLMEISGAKTVLIDGATQTIRERGAAPSRALTRRFLRQEYERLGFAYSEHAFGDGVNVIAEKPGTPGGRVLILSSHLDSVGNPGANDDGTGTAGALAIAKALSTMANRHTIRIVAFDREEQGLRGSLAYVAALPPADVPGIIGDIQLEMFGTNRRNDGRFHVIDCDRPDSRFLSERIMRSVTESGLGLVRSPACTSLSDHASFWRHGIPAIVISENFFGGDGDTCYHEACDVFDGRLDFGYMEQVLKAALGATIALSEAR